MCQVSSFICIITTLDNFRESVYGPNVVSVPSPGIMSCDRFRHFWLLWDDEGVKVGRGHIPGRYFLMGHKKNIDHPQKILSVGLSTGWGAAAEWEMSNTEGRS